MKFVHIINSSNNYEQMFLGNGWSIVNSLDHADLVQFTGGADVTPALYGESKHPKTCNAPARDEYEKGIYEECLAKKIKMAGICRGGQFLNVMNGGKMFQDVDGHTCSHNLLDITTGDFHRVTSTHHQMMIPNPDTALLVAEACISQGKERMEDGVRHIVKGGPDPEVIWYKDTQSLCFQPHPEYDKATAKYYFIVLNRYLEV